MVGYQINFRMGKSVPIKNWRGNRFGGETDGEIADGVCTKIVSEAYYVVHGEK